MRWILVLVSSSVLAQTAPGPKDSLLPGKDKQQNSAGKQWEAARKQAESVGAWLVPGRRADPPDFSASGKGAETLSSAADPACDVMSEESIAGIIEAAAKEQSVLPKLLHAVIEQESRFHPCAVSPKGAKGLMQLMPDTAAELGVTDPFDPKANVAAGAQYLKQLLDKYKGDMSQALGAYNAGPTAVDQAGGIPNIKETRDYVKSIMLKMGTMPPDPPSIPMPKPIEN